MDNIEITNPIISQPENLSSDEFKALLTDWYEEKGILSQLRAQLRFKMINVLKNTAIGREITKKTSQTSMCLSKHAVNLIVAEFLMKNNYEYSLSIFNTEAGLCNMYTNNLVNQSEKNLLQFDLDNLINILELVGINKMSELFSNILDRFCSNEENVSVLACLINMLSHLSMDSEVDPPDLKQKMFADLTCEPEFIKQVGRVLIDSHRSVDDIGMTIENLKCLHNSELKKLEDSYNKTINKLRITLKIKNKHILHIDKKKRVTEIKLFKIVGEYNALKHQMKGLVKDKLLKEQEIKNLKNSRENKCDLELENNKENNFSCKLDHCDNACSNNKQLIIELQKDNQELSKRNVEQREEFTELQKKYTELLNNFHFLQKKFNLLNKEVGENDGKSSTNLELNDQSHYENSDSADSLTDEVIRQAWLKLEKLEKESKEIEEQYKL
ncbi:unnamed protein product [Phyllotreta striolata]|uniref:LisH domain-containing protein n=1 Tax=Phyllotreta striolata TaxID=444603 RepID=A0A9N9TQH7_PHYSR|nr:unnamed protein product [Phyllotreta striolata]